MRALIRGGFTFLKELDNGKILMENKFTGLRVIYDEQDDTWEVLA